MLDLHCHILPGIDDGPRTMQAAVELGRALVTDGVDTVAATPHFRYDHPDTRVHELPGRCAELRLALDGEGVPLRIVSGAEVDLNAALSCTGEELRALTLGGRGDCLLVETPYQPVGRSFEDTLFRAVSIHGLRVLLAHPERNRTLQRDADRVEALVERGVLVQVTAAALLSRDRRSGSRRLANELLKRHVVHTISSDAHSHTGARAPRLTAAVSAAARIDPARAHWMVCDAPAALLAGEALPPAPPRAKRRGLLRRRASSR